MGRRYLTALFSHLTDALATQLDPGLAGEDGGKFLTIPLGMERAVLERVLVDEMLEVVCQRAGHCGGATRAGTTCGGCVPLVTELLKNELRTAGVEVANHLCEHFAYSRQQLFHLVRAERIRSFDELIERHGEGGGCEICQPAVASILARPA